MTEIDQEQLSGELHIDSEKAEVLRSINSIARRTLTVGAVSLILLTSCAENPIQVTTPPTKPEILLSEKIPIRSEQKEYIEPIPTLTLFNDHIEIEPEEEELPTQEIEITLSNPSQDHDEQVLPVIEKEREPNKIIHKEWSDEIKQVEIVGGKANFEAYLFLDKASDDNHSRFYTKSGDSAPIWNATEAAHRFGEVIMAPGDEISFTQRVGFGEIIPRNRQLYEDIEHGEGYIRNGEGAYLAATVMGEGLGLSVINQEGDKIPLFKAEEGAIHGHDFEYTDLYRGPGIGINSSEYGQFIFSLNPQLPEGVRVNIKMSHIDTNPTKPLEGLFSPIVTISIEGLPDEYKTLESMRMTAYRKQVLKMVTGREW